jgi:hypothetical protein
MPLQIIRGIQKSPIRAIIYGTEGIGKSTLAAQLPDPIIIDTEDGTKQIDCARALCLDWRSIESALKSLAEDGQGFKSVVIDSADWLEKALIEHMLRLSGKSSIEDYGFGKGYTMLQEQVMKFLSLCDKLIARGMHVVFVAHSKIVRVSPPDTTDGFDRFELKLTKQVGPVLKEWADLILFCNYELTLVEGSDKRIKAQGGKERIMHAERSAAWDAKNRFGLPEKMPMRVEEILHLFSEQAPRAAAPVKAEPVAEVEAQPAEPEAPTEDLATQEQVAKLDLYGQNTTGRTIIDQALTEANALDLGELTAAQAAALIEKCQQAMNGPTLPPAVVKALEGNEAKANAYLISISWITQGQTWRDLGADRIKTIAAKADRFLRAAGIK